jgi:RNA polymerase sigma-70 factor (sigma-E family)
VERYEGFAEFIAACGSSLSRTAYLLTGDHYRAEELLQSALVRTAPHWHRVVRGGNPEGYVRRAMINEQVSWWRRRQRTIDRPPERVPVADESAEAADRMTMAAALAQLPARQRAVVVLRYYHDYSVDEVAEALGCSPGTVKSQAHHGVKRLRELLPEMIHGRRTD